VQLDAALLESPDGPGASHFVIAQNGPFDARLSFDRPLNGSLTRGWLAMELRLDVAPLCSVLYADDPGVVSISTAWLVIDTPIAVAASTWGQLKSLYSAAGR
jgi:hypothetical protein